MLLTEKMKEEIEIFSPSEKSIIEYMFEQRENIKNKTVKQISNETYTHPSTLVRVGKKLGYSGWIDLRDTFLEEIDYLNSHFSNIDANLPFTEYDNVMTIANKLAKLNQMTISDTLSLINHDELQKATDLIKKATSIKIFAMNNNLILCHDFKAKMNRIGRKVDLAMVDPEYEVASCDSETCAIVISYTGETESITKLLPMLKNRKIPIIALTSIGDNTLTKSSDYIFRLTTRERLYSKIGSFSLNDSICFLLDVLYASIFSEDYQKNLKYTIDVSKSFDPRKSSNKVMEENNQE
ncbi:MurR/RpiR family transcriptional regulator [Bacillus sp. CLL-7-23]|uniref:MurR/RpiR family transcriptional regulator n=1 Tax=Bacillus changyiensis TaxID=3004103 RepID=A0ABT4X7N8_9BACI|nr:MurR/RpiR family transcriptional regulator [Bacillus changyiensis]MDA7028210.1 MurR/RpiR family transcriptional regulator [Bacillus changyiensis]